MKRRSNIEILRIIAMFMIVLHHFMIHGVLRNAYTGSPLNVSMTKIIADLCESGGKLGVDIFLMISGYFLIKSTPKIKKIWTLLAQVWFYSLIFFILNLFLHIVPIDKGLIISSIFPFSYETYWFVTVYVIIYLFSPYLNDYLLSINKEKFRKLLFLMILITIVIPTVLPRSIKMTSPLFVCFTFYTTGAYIRLFVNDNINNKKRGKLLSLVMFLACLCTVIGFNIVGKMTGLSVLSTNATYFTVNGSSVVIYLLAMGLLLWFRGLKTKNYRWINLISGATFGVYLIHDNPVARQWLWQDFIPTLKYLNYQPIYFVINVFIIAVIVYMVCTVIELIRQYLFGCFTILQIKKDKH